MNSIYVIRILLLILFLFRNTHLNGQTKYQKDFESYWRIINENFSYFDTQKTDWDRVKTIYQPHADTISSNRSFVRLLETVNNELYNGHISLNVNLPSSNRLIPTGADLWIVYQNKQFIISSIRKHFKADQCGLKPGMIIKRFNEIHIDNAVRQYLPKSILDHDQQMYEYAGNMLLAGTHDVKRRITVKSNKEEKTYYPDSLIYTEPSPSAILEYKIIASGVGYIKINNSLGNFDLIKEFDKALHHLWNTKGIILDLRETPSGGNTTIARAIMGRFITKELPYQKHSLPSEEKLYRIKRSWVEMVSPRDSIYKKKLVVLVNRWTGSMGEGIAIGFDGMKRARVVGDKMAGLLGAIYSFSLPETKIGFSIPAEKLYHIYGTPREQFIPAYREADNEKTMIKAIDLLKNSK